MGRREGVGSCWMMTSLLYSGDRSIVRRLHYCFYITQHFEFQYVHTLILNTVYMYIMPAPHVSIFLCQYYVTCYEKRDHNFADDDSIQFYAQLFQ